LSGRSRFPLAGECPLCGAERLEDGAPAPRDRLLRKGLVLLVLAHTKRLSEIPESLFYVYMQFVATDCEQCSRGECPLYGAGAP